MTQLPDRLSWLYGGYYNLLSIAPFYKRRTPGFVRQFCDSAITRTIFFATAIRAISLDSSFTMSIPLFLLSFNMAKVGLNAHEFTETLTQNLPDDTCDLYVFGFQELCSTLDGCFPMTVQKRLIEINRVLLHGLKAKYDIPQSTIFNFTTVGMHSAGAIGIIAITPFILKFSTARFADASCGTGSTLTKGAVGLRIKYICEDTSITELTFGNAHLCANEGELQYQQRVQNLHSVMRAMNFGDNYNFLKPRCHTFFMGDLNFRTSKKGTSPVSELLDLPLISLIDPVEPNDEHAQLIVSLVKKYDELTAGRENGELFSGFEEPCISFLPTYKHHLGTAIYSGFRSPLWCDRILYQSTYRTGTAPIVHKYMSMPLYFRSDHRPVYLHITIPTEAPKSIIDTNGHLVVIPPSKEFNVSKSCSLIDTKNEVSGPTQVYMKSTPLDKLQQLIARPIADTILGYGLWFGTTSSGRVISGLFIVLLWLVFYCY